MQDYKRGSHTIWDCKYHIVWVTKYRYPILTGDVGERARELLREIARANEMTIYAGAINRDHVHMLISIPPQLSVSRAVQALKGPTPLGAGLLGRDEWKCDRRGVETIYRGPKA